ncbi:MAG: hypothetical protein IPM91_22740 [Bacteroidetes bacterium]|nr:hypothetical protein [Bacteroidota bacterium]
MKNNCIDIPSKVVSLFTRVTLLILVSASTLYSQEFEWQNTIGGSLYDNLTSISQTVEGGYIFGGASNSAVSGDKKKHVEEIMIIGS